MSGLAGKEEEKQVNALIYVMGDEADDVMLSFGLSDSEKKEYGTVTSRFEQHFTRRRNTIFERAKFNQRIQNEGEVVDSFITALYCLAEHCGFGTLKGEMIRDRIVVGVRDGMLSEKLQLDSDLTLDIAINAACRNEAVKQQQTVVRGEDLNAVGLKPSKQSPYSSESRSVIQKGTSKSKSCIRCGRSPTHSLMLCALSARRRGIFKHTACPHIHRSEELMQRKNQKRVVNRINTLEE